MVTQRASEAGQALTLARHMVTRPGAVHTLWTRLAAAVAVEPRRADCSVGTGGEESRWQGEIEEVYPERVIKAF